MDRVELDVIQNDKGQLVVIDQDGRRLAKVKSVSIRQCVHDANEVTVTFLQIKKGDLIGGNQVEYRHGRT